MAATFSPKSDDRKRKAATRSSGRERPPKQEAGGAPAGLPRFLGAPIQKKLAVGAVNDPLEREADRVAEQVTSSAPVSSAAGAGVQRKCACGGSSSGTCEECQQRQEELPSAPVIQRRATSESQSGADAPHIVHDALRSPGKPLDTSVRQPMESRLGGDFSDVRVHTDSLSAASAQAVNALAYTAGEHVVFGEGQYQPESPAGQKLLAHELAHVVQQDSDASIIHRQPTGAKQQTAPPQKTTDWHPGMFARVVKDFLGYKASGMGTYKVGEILEITSEPYGFGTHNEVQFVYAALPGRPRGTYVSSVGVENLVPTEAPAGSTSSDEVRFNVNVLSTDAFARATGIDPTRLPEGTIIPLDQVQSYASPDQDPRLSIRSPGAGFGMSQAPWPAFDVPPYATGVQWTQSGFGHFSQFSNVPGSPTIGGYRSYGAVHGFQGVWSKITGEPWTTPVPGGYHNDWWFRLFPSGNQNIIYRSGSPQHAELVSRLIDQGSYSDPYTFPPTPTGEACSNCITVPRTETFGALGGRPVIVTDDGVYDIQDFGRMAPDEPFTEQQAGRGKTMREWLAEPTVQTDAGEIQTLNVATVRPSTVWGARGVTCIRTGGYILLIYGVYKTASRIEEAEGTPYLGRVIAQESGSWVGGIIGGALGTAGAAAIACSPTGPGALACAAAGFVGGLVLGMVGSYFGAVGGDYLYDRLEGTASTAGEVFSPMIEQAMWGRDPIPGIGYYPPRQYLANPDEYEAQKQRYMKSQAWP